MNINIRFYPREFPEQESLVQGKIVRIAEQGAYIELLEYDGLEAFISFSQLLSAKVKYIKRNAKVGQTKLYSVYTVDEEKEMVDLTEKNILAEERKRFREKLGKWRICHSVFKQFAYRHFKAQNVEPTKELLTDLAARTIWKLDIDSPTINKGTVETFELKEEERELFLRIFEEKYPTNYELLYTFRLFTTAEEGVETLKSLIQGAYPENDKKLKLVLMDAPTFTIRYPTKEPEKGQKTVLEYVERLSEAIETRLKDNDFKVFFRSVGFEMKNMGSGEVEKIEIQS